MTLPPSAIGSLRTIPGPLPSIGDGGSVMGFRLSPDARRVAIQIKRGGARGHALFVASADGTGTAIQLTPDENDLVILRSWTRFSPDGKRIVYGTYSSSASATRHLYSASILGILPPALLSGQVPYDVTGFEITADSSRVVYHRHGQQDALSVGKLASRPGPRGSLLVDLDVRLPEEDDIAQLTAALSTLDGIRLRAATAGFE